MYCPKCGKESFHHVSGQRHHCDACGFTFYRNSASAVAVILRCGDEILLAVRGRDPEKGKLDLPGGFVNNGESLEQAAVREIGEELGLEVKITRYLFSEPNIYPYRNVDYHTTDAFFEVVLEHRPEIVVADDVANVVWVNIANIDFDRIAFSSVKKALGRYISG